MKIMDKILELLVSGVPLGEIRTKFNSQSQLCSALAEYFDLIEDKNCEGTAALDDLTKAQEEISADAVALKMKREELDVDFQNSVEHKDALDSAVEKIKF